MSLRTIEKPPWVDSLLSSSKEKEAYLELSKKATRFLKNGVVQQTHRTVFFFFLYMEVVIMLSVPSKGRGGKTSGENFFQQKEQFL